MRSASSLQRHAATDSQHEHDSPLRLAHLEPAEYRSVQTAVTYLRNLGSAAPHASQKETVAVRHAMGIASILADMGADAQVLLATLCASALRMQPSRTEEMERAFGSTVIRHAEQLLTAMGDGGVGTTAGTASSQAIISLLREDMRFIVALLADRLQRCRELPLFTDEHRASYARKTLALHSPLADRLCMLDLRDEMDGHCLRALHAAVHASARTARERATEIAREEIIPDLETTLQHAYPCSLIPEDIPWKDLLPIAREQIHNIRNSPGISIAIVCSDTPACYGLLSVLHQTWRQEIGSFSDSINSPRMNGYRGLHTTLIQRDGTRIHCRIRAEDMQMYAHRGVASLCFGGDPLGIAECLPWVEQYTRARDPLRSGNLAEEFRRNIASEQITVYGATDKPVFLPSNATVLDAALRCFEERALWAEAILVNGRRADFHSALRDGDSVALLCSSHLTVDASWLQSVRMGLSASVIRGALAARTPERKVEIGRRMLQSLMQERQKGFLEEFQEQAFAPSLRTIGYRSLDDALEAIAEGSADPERIYNTLFRDEPRLTSMSRASWRITGVLPSRDADILRTVVLLCRRYGATIRYVQWSSGNGQRVGGRASISAFLSAAEKRSFCQDLRSAGMLYIEAQTRTSMIRYAAAAVAIMAFWGMDPVLATALLRAQDISPFAFSLMRTLGFSVFCFLHVLLVRRHKPRTSLVLPWDDAFFWLGGAALAVTSIATYESLTELLPQEYVTITLSSGAVIPILSTTLEGENRRSAGIGGVVLLASLLGMAMLRPEGVSAAAVIGSAALLAGFSIFTVCIDQLKKRQRIDAGLPWMLFLLSGLALLLHLPLVPFAPSLSLDTSALVLPLVYGAVIVGIPYTLFYRLVATDGARWLWLYAPIIPVVTLASQSAVFRTVWLWGLLPLGLITVCVLLFHAYRPRYPIITGQKES